MTQPLVTILIPNYKTPILTKLCLRLLRKNTKLNDAHVIVIDNDSQDESTQYCRSLKWIELIERKPEKDDTPSLSHSRALDLALKKVTTPYVLIIHTDTMVKDQRWLNFLLNHIQNKETIAGVGSWKLESKPWHKRILKTIEKNIQLLWYKMTNKKKHALEGVGDNYYYLRSHCALYRMDLIKKFNLTFSANQDTAGRIMHKTLVDAGYDMIFLSSEALSQYIDHINHATMVLNPTLGSRQKSIIKGNNRIITALKKLNADKILKDDHLDIVS